MRGSIGTLFSVVLLALSVEAADSAGAPKNFHDEQTDAGLRAADAAQLLAARNRDANALDRMMHEKFAVSSPEGQIWPREKVLAMWRNRGIGHDRFERTVENVILVQNVGVVSGHEIVQPSSDSVAGQRRNDGGKRVQRRYTNVWIWDQGRWWFLARHANEVTENTP